MHNASSPDYALLSSLNLAMNDTYGNNKEDIPEVDLRTVTHGIPQTIIRVEMFDV